MAKHKTAELEGALLDAAVAKAEDKLYLDGAPSPTEDWAVGGPIIERERIMVGPEQEYADGTWLWEACGWDRARGHGSTPLIAAMRAYVASNLGEEVELP